MLSYFAFYFKLFYSLITLSNFLFNDYLLFIEITLVCITVCVLGYNFMPLPKLYYQPSNANISLVWFTGSAHLFIPLITLLLWSKFRDLFLFSCFTTLYPTDECDHLMFVLLLLTYFTWHGLLDFLLCCYKRHEDLRTGF